MSTQPAKISSWLKDCLFLSITIGILFCILLGNRSLFVPDEGRYAEIAREMLASGNYVTPYLNHIKYFEKPILFYWLGAAALKMGGINLWSIRLINAVLGVLGCILTYFTARKLYDRCTGLLAALILATSTLYFVMAHMVSLDLPVTVFMSASLYFFLLGTEALPGSSRRFYLWGSAASAALAVLTKGLIGLVFPAMIIGAWIALLNDWRLLTRLYLPSSLFIFFLIATPWHYLVGQANPEFFYFYFIEQHFLRYATMDVGHYQPAWFFIPVFVAGFFPWIIFLPQTLTQAVISVIKHGEKYKFELFFLLWAMLIFAFFSFSKSKLIPYILPIFPPFAILTSRYLLQTLQQKKYLALQLSFFGLLLISTIIAYTFFNFVHTSQLPDIRTACFYLYSAVVILGAGTIISCYFTYRNPVAAITTLIVTSSLFLVSTLAAIPSIDTRSIRPLADIIKPISQPSDEVITYNQYYQDLPFYLEKRVSILNWKNELSFGIQHQDTHDWIINDTAFWQRFHDKNRVFVIMSLEEYQHLLHTHPKEKIHLLGKTINNALISNKENN